MKKFISFLLVVFLITQTSTIAVKAETTPSRENALLTENSLVVHTEERFSILVPTEADPFGVMPTTRGVITFFVVNGAILGACDAVEFYSNWNPCITTKDAILTHIKNTKLANGSYKYKVNREWIAGSIPGCESVHSGICNSGYYRYTFVRVNELKYENK